MMTAKALNLIPSGIEPVDKLLGGLESGQLYLAHGEAAGKSLFGIQFLIEGLKRGENGALVIRYSAQDAVRRFARLGYDCLDDVQQGRLVILEYSEDIINQIQKLAELEPVLRELEWLLKDARPQRMIFDPVTQLVLGEKGELRPRVVEFSTWASSFGATVLLIANGNGNDVIQELTPLVRDSFKFDFKETDGRATRFFTFEKSPNLAEQAVEVDPTRGIFLLERTPNQLPIKSSYKPRPTPEPSRERASTSSALGAMAEIEAPVETPVSAHTVIEPLIIESQSSRETNINTKRHEAIAQSEIIAPEASMITAAEPQEEILSEALEELQSEALEELQSETLEESQRTMPHDQDAPTPTANRAAEFGRTSDESVYDFSDFLEELDSAIAAIDMNFTEAKTKEAANLEAETGVTQIADERFSTAQTLHDNAGDVTDLPTENERSVGYSKRALEGFYADDRASHWATINTLTAEPQAQINPKDFHIVLIDEDDLSCKRVFKALEEYTVLAAQDMVSGIANIMALNADLIILDIDMSIADGFKVLSHIRASTSAPIIVLSKMHIRSADRIFSSELGADYYLTKPFSAKELKHKTKQLIARYKGIDAWIVAPNVVDGQAMTPSAAAPPAAEATASIAERRAHFSGGVVALKTERMADYAKFIEQVEANIKRSMERGTAFSIVGYKLESAPADGEEKLHQVADLLASSVRNADIVSLNESGELVILLHDTNSIGARAFISRARRRLPENLNQQLSTWMRSFPNLEEEFESAYAS